MTIARFEKKLRHQQQRWFLEYRRRDWEERHQRFGASVYLLEPNIKQGEGGLRDVHALRWLAFLFYGTTALEALEQHDLVTAAERDSLLKGVEMLLRVRNVLHVIEGRKSDVLHFDKQARIAEALGYHTEGHFLAEELFMRDYYLLARETFRIGQHVIRDLTEPTRRRGWLEREREVDGALHSRGGRLFVAGDEKGWFEQDPPRLVSVFARAAELKCEIAEPTRRAIEQVVKQPLDGALSENTAARDAFLAVLRSRNAVGPILRDMHETGVLSAYLPEFEHLFCMVRADSYHKYTVDEHSLRAVESADRLRAGDPAVPEMLRREAKEIRRWDLLYFAVLIHDIGKGEGHGHVLRGGQIAQRIAARMDLPVEDGEIIRRLVADHLKMTHVALRRDLDDPRTIERTARDAGDIEYLRLLYALTYCDLSAVSPESWTEWKSVLLAELFAKTAAFLAGKPSAHWSGASHEQLLEAVRAHLTMPEEEHGVRLDDYLTELPERYIASTESRLIAHHYEMIDALDEENRIVWELRHPPGARYSELTVVAYDRPGVFSILCGALASKRINILGAQVFSTKGGGVIDRFQITDSRGEPLPEGFVLERLRNDVNRIFLGKKTVEDLFDKVHGDKRPRASADLQMVAPPKVEIDSESSDHSTIIEVYGYDRLGLLYDITHVFTNHNLSIDLAIITTEAYRVVDVFYVTDSDNNKIDDPLAIERLRKELLEVISV
jgi:[protein-PII] uridylyltransferase